MEQDTNAVIQTIMERRSIRHFTDRPIGHDELALIVQSAINAPNGNNKQTWRMTILDKSAEIKEYRDIVSRVLEETQTDSLHGFYNPSALVIVTNRKDNYNAMADGACAIENMLLAAWSLGMGGVLD